jgi:hypothetical protein
LVSGIHRAEVTIAPALYTSTEESWLHFLNFVSAKAAFTFAEMRSQNLSLGCDSHYTTFISLLQGLRNNWVYFTLGANIIFVASFVMLRSEATKHLHAARLRFFAALQAAQNDKGELAPELKCTQGALRLPR